MLAAIIQEKIKPFLQKKESKQKMRASVKEIKKKMDKLKGK